MRKIALTLILLLNMSVYISAQDHQPEYTSYEAPGTTDMVNLLTGDFVYNMPLLHVPGPEKGFDLPLSYHGGIRYDQKASWVGLGWSLNCGAISRNVSRYPDDFQGEKITSKLENEGVTAVSRNWTVFSDVYHSEKGYGYQLMLGGLSASWGSAVDDAVSVIGIGWDFDGSNTGFTFDAEETVIGVIQIAATLVDYGVITNTALSTVIGILDGISTAYTTIQGIDQLSSTFSDYSGMQGLWKETTKYSWFDKECLLKTTQKNFLNSNIDEYAYGTLYLGYLNDLVPHNSTKWYNGDTGEKLMHANSYNRETNYVHDYYMYVDDDAEYQWTMNPVNIAYDQYSVMGGGISGSIYPYRLDIGSVSTNNYENTYDFGKYIVSKFTAYKVNFRYKGDIANAYHNHTGEGYGAHLGESDLSNQFGISYTDDGSHYKILVNDDNLLYAENKIESDREGLYSNMPHAIWHKKLAAGRHIEWFSNYEITNGTAKNYSNFMDFLPETESKAFRDRHGEGKLDNGIGGYCITREDGVTYHYALPIYTIYTYSYSESDIEGVTNNSVSEYINQNPYAIDWLLTAITGPDFVDRNNNNVVDDGDWGYWVKFNYTKGEYSRFRTPYEGYIYSADETQWSYSLSQKETFYLKSIETPSHVAFFDKSVRQDGKTIFNNEFRSYRLDNIYLFAKEDYKEMTSLFSSQIDNLEMSDDDYQSDPELEAFINSKQIKRIHFDYDYHLCWQDPTNFSGGGRLSLNSVGFYGLNNTKLMPDFTFFYGNNPGYNKDNWDGWGMYSPTGSNSNRTATSFGTQWSLEKIITPNGGIIEIDLERDKYGNVAGYNLENEKYGGNIRVKEITVDDGVNPKVSNKYIYTWDGTEEGPTSGFCSIEPEYDRTESLPLYSWKKKTSLYNYPRTPVIYKHVTVLKEKLEDEYLSKTEFEFIPPNYTMIECLAKDDFVDDGKLANYPAKWANYIIVDKTNQIGALKSIKKYYSGDLVQSISYNYTDNLPNDQGIFTQGTIFAEHCNWGGDAAIMRLFRTTNVEYPNVLESIVMESGNKKTIITNAEFDFVTGLVTKKEYVNEPGNDFIVEHLPAYKVYPEMGYKAEDYEYKNMLTQKYAEITYLKEDETLKVKKASVQTWNNDWNYKVYDKSLNYYTVENNTDVYRLKGQYIWVGEINEDGTYSSLDFGNFDTVEELKQYLNVIENDGTNNWRQVTNIETYNPYSFPIQVKDINEQYNSLKPDVFNEYIIATAANASYEEFGFTSFENYLDDTYFDSELFVFEPGAIEKTGETSHTGEYSLKSNRGGIVNTTIEFENDKYNCDESYKTNMWIKPLNSQNDFQIKVTYSFKGVNQSETFSEYKYFDKSNSIKFGDWYLIEYISSRPDDISEIGEIGSLSIVINNSADNVVYVDDLRYQPVNSQVESFVYNISGTLNAALSNNNIAIKYEYDEAGKLKAVYKEIPGDGANGGFKKVSEHDYGYSRAY